MKTSRLLKAEIIILALVGILWAVDLKTDCVPRAAAGALRQVVRISPNSERAYNLLGDTYYSFDQCDRGNKAYEQAEIVGRKEAVEFRSKDPEVYLEVGNEYCDANDYETAVTYYRKAVELDPDWFWGHLRLGLAYSHMGQYENAILEWQRLAELEPEEAVAHVLSADTYLEMGQYQKAIEASQKALRIDPGSVSAHYNLGRAHLEMGNKDLASEEYRTLKGLDKELAEELHRLIEQGQEVRDGSH